MRTNTRFLFKLFTIFTVLTYTTMQTVPAFADDGVPPASDPQPVVDSQSEEPAAPEEVISQLPEGTDVVVVSESGDALPLAAQAAADGFVEGDPMWCPAGVAPKAGIGGCSPAFTSFNDDGAADTGLIAWLAAANINKAGTIWVASDYAPVGGEGGEIIIDPTATVGVAMGAYALTIQGGWLNNPTGSKALDTADPYSYFTSQLSVSNWGGAVTINNIVFDGVHTNVADGTQAGLFVNTKGNITLNNVTVRDSVNDHASYTMTGALLLNNINGTGNIIINNSSFSGNEGTGLNVHTNGMITANGLIASSNGEYGAYLTNDYTQGKAVTLKGFKQFNDNGWSGLWVSSAGAISISNLVANDNGYDGGGFGVYLTNTISTAGLGITLTGTNFTMDNMGTGLWAQSHGVITASNLNASGNEQFGAVLDNCQEISGCDVAKGKMVKLSGVNVFNGNGVSGNEDGLVIKSYGAISISNLMASNNYGSGVSLDNQWHNLNNVDSTGTVTITGYGIFQNNVGDGAEIYSYGNAVLTNVDASGNGEGGLYMQVEKALGGSSITINGVNNFSNNGQNGISPTDGLDGLELYANGTITLSNVTAIGNASGAGADLGNLFHPLKPYNVVLKGTNKFNENGEAGLLIASFGTIQVNNLMASNNTGVGALLDNCIGFGSCATLSPKAVTITGYAITSHNLGGMGLMINSYGAITLNNVTAEGNGLEGTVLYNDSNLTGQAVTLKGSNTFNNNGGDGGLGVFTQGAITANNITAFGNDGVGAILINCNCGPVISAKNVTLTGVNTFVGNGMDGLWVEASGSVVLSRVTASNNDPDLDDNGVGIYVIADGNITLTCAFTTDNYGGGYYLDALGKITLNGVYSNNLAPDITLSPFVPTIKKPCALP